MPNSLELSTFICELLFNSSAGTGTETFYTVQPRMLNPIGNALSDPRDPSSSSRDSSVSAQSNQKKRRCSTANYLEVEMAKNEILGHVEPKSADPPMSEIARLKATHKRVRTKGRRCDTFVGS